MFARCIRIEQEKKGGRGGGGKESEDETEILYLPVDEKQGEGGGSTYRILDRGGERKMWNIHRL